MGEGGEREQLNQREGDGRKPLEGTTSSKGPSDCQSTSQGNQALVSATPLGAVASDSVYIFYQAHSVPTVLLS